MRTNVYQHIGKRRENQEDSYLSLPESGVFAVADGMGGHDYGEVASNVAVEKLREIVLHHQGDLHRLMSTPETREFGLNMLKGSLPEVLVAINNAVRLKGCEMQANMGSTLSMLWFVPGVVFVAHTGDSVIYRYRDGQLKRMTAEHKFGPYLMGGVGVSENVTGENHSHYRKENDVYLLCSDGVTTHLSDDELQRFFDQASSHPVGFMGMPYRIATECLRRGGFDNITAMVVIEDRGMSPVLTKPSPLIVRYGGPF